MNTCSCHLLWSKGLNDYEPNLLQWLFQNLWAYCCDLQGQNCQNKTVVGKAKAESSIAIGIVSSEYIRQQTENMDRKEGLLELKNTPQNKLCAQSSLALLQNHTFCYIINFRLSFLKFPFMWVILGLTYRKPEASVTQMIVECLP